MNEQKYPHIAIIEEVYKASTGNLLCREKGKNQGTHPYDWPIFVPKEFASQITTLPIYGILIKDFHPAYKNGERITCRVLSYDKEELKENLNFDSEL